MIDVTVTSNDNSDKASFTFDVQTSVQIMPSSPTTTKQSPQPPRPPGHDAPAPPSPHILRLDAIVLNNQPP